MSIAIKLGVRLLYRVDPVPGESPRGYLCRVAHTHAYGGPLSLAQIAGLPVSGLESDEGTKQIAHVLRLEAEEWRAMCYQHIKGRKRFRQRLFCGQRISADDLNYKCPRICPGCLKKNPIWWAVWDLGLVTACPLHRCLLLNRCPACHRGLAWQRAAVHKCRCGLDLRDLSAEGADREMVAINAAICRAAGFPVAGPAEFDLSECNFPPEMLELRLGSLLRLILFVGSIREKDRLRRKQRPFVGTDIGAASEIGRAAATVLRDWPKPFREILRCMLPPETENPAALNFKDLFGNFYRHLFRVLPRSEFGFLNDVFERFVIEDWKGLIRGQHRYFSPVVRQKCYWVTPSEAERMARMAGGRILDLVRQGQLHRIFLSAPGSGGRTECWIRRESLTQWIAHRDADLARYMTRPEAKRALGLTDCTVVKVAAAGPIRYVKGPDRNFPSGFFYFLRGDVIKIKEAFESYGVATKAYSKPGKLIALRHAMKNYLGRDLGLADVIRAVVGGNLAPVGCTKRFRGITGYLFLSDELRKYRPVSDVRVPHEEFLNYREAASLLGIRTNVVRGLVLQGFLTAPAGYRNGYSKLIPAKQIQRFADRYVAATAIAKHYNLSSWSFARYLRESGTSLLAVSIPDEGKGHALFLPKDTAAHVVKRLRLNGWRMEPSGRSLADDSKRSMFTDRS